MDELTGHYVNYRKQISPSENRLLPESSFQLYGITARYPRKLFQEYEPEEIKKGVYDLPWGGNTVRVIVLSRLAKETKNAMLLLFAGKSESMQFGATHYEWKHQYLCNLINDLFKKYEEGGIPMTYTIDDYLQDSGNAEAIKYRAIELQLEKERREKEQILLRERKERKEKEQILLREKEKQIEIERLKKLIAEKGIEI